MKRFCQPFSTLAASAMLLYCSAVSAQESDMLPVLSLPEAVTRTLADNPSLKVAGFQLDIQEARILQASIKPRPELNLMVENVVGNGEYTGLDVAQTTLSVAWLLTRGLTESRTKAARASRTALEEQMKLGQMDAATETARRYLACLVLQNEMQIAQGAISLARETVGLMTQRMEAGVARPGQLARAEAELAWRELRLEDIEHELLSARYRLSAQWGADSPDFSLVTGDLFNRPEIEAYPAILDQLENNPELNLYLSRQRLYQANLELEQARNLQPWGVSAGLRRFEQTDDFGLVADFTLPLGRQDANRGNVEAARAALGMTEQEKLAERLQLQTELFVIYQELAHSIHLSRAIAEDILPLREQSLAEVRQAFEQGNASYLEVDAAQQALTDTRYALVEASAGLFERLIQIERLTGLTLELPTLAP